ncbi:hypothetical protein M8J76_015782, partial [Diaphorina citri]
RHLSSNITFEHVNYTNSRARCSTVKQLLDTYHGVTSSAPLMPPTHPPTLETTPALPQTADQVPAASSETPTACQYKPETSLNWEEQFVDLTSFCNSHIQMALIPDEEFAVSSQATEQRNGPDVFFGSEVASSSGIDLLDAGAPYCDLLYKGSSQPKESGGMKAPSAGLKLNVDLMGSDPVADSDPADLLNTPDVIKAFDDVDSFDLLDYVFNQDKKPVLFELDKQGDDPADSYASQEPALTLLLGKQNQNPQPIKPSGKSLFPLLEPKNPLSDNSSIGNSANTAVNKPKQIATIRPKRIKQKKMFDDFVYDTMSPVTVKKEEESDGEFSNLVTTTVKKKLLTIPARKRNISCSSTSSSTFSSTKKRRLTDDEDVLEYESGKYRELRNRNNEASRRSRANRKQREHKMKEYADKLMSDNVRLKTRSEHLEKQVEKFRNCLMQIVLSNNKKR